MEELNKLKKFTTDEYEFQEQLCDINESEINKEGTLENAKLLPDGSLKMDELIYMNSDTILDMDGVSSCKGNQENDLVGDLY